jgi:predicted enzyme related to lactoylglutathione lyase
MSQHEKIDYVEFPAQNMSASKEFFSQVFGWEFKDFGAEYTAFEGQGLNGGFYQSDKNSTTNNGAALIVFYSADLESTEEKIKQANGKIIKETFSFPGGRRFHFSEPSGNEFAVWSDK